MAILLFLSVWRKKVWRMNGSAKGLSMVGINLDGFSLANRLRFAKFAKLSPRQTFPLYGILAKHKTMNPMVAEKGHPPAAPPKAAASSGTAAAHGGAWSGMLPPEAAA